MTETRHVTPLVFEDLDDVVRSLRAAGHRLTTPARLVLGTLFAADGPLSAERIASGLDGDGMRLELTSVYRNLERLQDLGVVRHLHVGHGPGLYVLTRGGRREYLVCERCSRVVTVDRAALDPVHDSLQHAFGFQADFSHFPIHGRCVSCQGEDLPDRPGSHPARGASMPADEHTHAHPHSHEHHHGDHVHSHPHADHEHEHVQHEHEHSHGDLVHSHAHVHQAGHEHLHEHEHGKTPD